ncbi:enoyl-CoA hydratase/isomerase family protein, partial [Rhizobiaceae sp. 2RAB30]
LCDVIVCGQSARFGFPFIKLGLVPDFGVSFSLPRRVGVQAARKALMEGLTYSGADALAIGLVDACVEDEQVSEAALDKAIVLAAA